MAQPANKKVDSETLIRTGSHATNTVDGATSGKGKPQRNYPPVTLQKALAVARAIQDGASGMSVNRLTLAELMHNSPSSSTFVKLLQASRMYGLTTGGVNANTFGLTTLGEEATGTDEEIRFRALRQAVLSIQPYKEWLTAFSNGKKIAAQKVCLDFLVTKAKVPAERANECLQFMLTDARFVHFTRMLGDSEYIDLEGTPSRSPASGSLRARDEEASDEDTDALDTSERPSLTVVKPPTDNESAGLPKPKKVFIAHGKDHGPMEQVKKMLDQFKVPCAVAVDEPNKGRPISTKVANLMRNECSSAIVIFTADERFIQEDDNGNRVEVWRPSENVIYELGAASILYDRNIVIFKDKRVTLPSDFSDLGYIPFEEGQIEMQMLQLVKELVAMDFLELRAKA